MSRRKKLSTTISPESYEFLEELIKSGLAPNLAGALDLALASVRQSRNRERLERATASYFENLEGEPLAEENTLPEKLTDASRDVNFDE